MMTSTNFQMMVKLKATFTAVALGFWMNISLLKKAHPEISGAAAIAAKHEKWDERPVILAVKAEGASLSEADLLSYYDNKIAKWQIPDKVIFVEQLPLGATGKILKRELRIEYENVLLNG